jgi:predicted RNA polymerase sigma factor
VTDPHAAIAAVFRIEFPRLVAGLARLTREVGRAEELAQDALVVALERWPTDGVPDNPGAWLMTTAKRRALDGVRHARIVDAKHVQLARDRDADPRWETSPTVTGAACARWAPSACWRRLPVAAL